MTRAAFGVAGPVIDQRAQMTNIEWAVDGGELTTEFGFTSVRLLNDLEAMATSLPVLRADECTPLQRGTAKKGGNIALIAAGTGLGEAVLHCVAGSYVPLASEGGHTDFAARTEREIDFVRYLRGFYGRAEVEHVLSGRGLLNLSDFTHLGGRCAADPAGDIPTSPAEVSTFALAATCDKCVEALTLFLAAYGAAAGNLALTAMTTGGVFVGGGIAPRTPAGASERDVRPGLQRQRADAAAARRDAGVGDPERRGGTHRCGGVCEWNEIGLAPAAQAGRRRFARRRAPIAPLGRRARALRSRATGISPTCSRARATRALLRRSPARNARPQ